MKKIAKLLLVCLLAEAAHAEVADQFEYLEQVNSEKALEWVTEQTAATKNAMESYKDFNSFQDEAYKLLTSPERIISVTVNGDYVYHLLQNKNYIKGLWRRQSLRDYKAQKSNWENVLDLDALSKKEAKSWSLKGADCLSPEYRRCLLSLSNGGGDAVVFDAGPQVSTLSKQVSRVVLAVNLFAPVQRRGC